MRPLLISLLLAAASLQAAPQPIATGKGARVEQALKSGLVRLGSNTIGQIREDGSLQLDQGLALVSSNSGLLRRSAIEVNTPAGVVTVRGTALIALLADGSLKITCLEGKVKGSLAGQKQTLESGHLLWLPKNGKLSLAEVELNSLVQSCALLGEGFKPLAKSSAIASLGQRQTRAFEKAAASHSSTHQIASGTNPGLSDQPGTQGASTLVALSNVMAASQGAGPTSFSSFTYSSGSSSTSTVSSGSTISSGAATQFISNPSSTGGTLSMGSSTSLYSGAMTISGVYSAGASTTMSSNFTYLGGSSLNSVNASSITNNTSAFSGAGTTVTTP